MRHRGHVLCAELKPAHRTIEIPRQRRDHRLLGVRHQLRAECATDVGADDADLRLRQAQGLGDLAADVERDLRRSPHPDAAFAVGLRDDSVALDRNRREPLVDEPAAHDDVSALERAVFADVELEGYVVALVGMHERRARIGSCGAVDKGCEWLVIDHHLCRRVDGLLSGFAHGNGDRVAHELHALAAQPWPRRVGCEQVVAGGENSGDPRHATSRARINTC